MSHARLPNCGCYRCVENDAVDVGYGYIPFVMTQMIVCATCGNKRCPHGTDHNLGCTGSNLPGQPGSRYGESAL
jgi:hypothetical protein